MTAAYHAQKKIFSAYGTKRRHAIKFSKRTPTKQSFRDECDINQIMAKFQKTGAISHVNRHGVEYGFATSHDFRESMEIVTKANEMFDELPSSIRSKFLNQPELFLEFVQDPANQAEMQKMGLTINKSESTDESPKGSPEGDPKPPAGSSKPGENAETAA